jgi:hypothetical protein
VDQPERPEWTDGSPGPGNWAETADMAGLDVELRWPEGIGSSPQGTQGKGARPTASDAQHAVSAVENTTPELDGELRADLNSYVRMTLESSRAALIEAENDAVARFHAQVDRKYEAFTAWADARQYELRDASVRAREDVKGVFTQQAQSLERLVSQCHNDLEQIVEGYIVELEKSITSGTVEFNSLADRRFAEFNTAVSARIQEFQTAATRSASTIAEAAQARVDELERRLRVWASEQEAGFSQRVETVVARSRALARTAALASVMALLAVGIAVAALLVAR